MLAVLRTWGLAVSAEEEQRIAGCQDAGLLSNWLVRAVTASATQDIFVGE